MKRPYCRYEYQNKRAQVREIAAAGEYRRIQLRNKAIEEAKRLKEMGIDPATYVKPQNNPQSDSPSQNNNNAENSSSKSN